MESAKREAAAAFGDERVLLERFIERPRHIEVHCTIAAGSIHLTLGPRAPIFMTISVIFNPHRSDVPNIIARILIFINSRCFDNINQGASLPHKICHLWQLKWGIQCIQVQIIADQHGNVIHLYERDCSVQRRHQKVLEEAPAPNISDSFRRSICEAAIAAARAVGYISAGTGECRLQLI